MNRETSHIRAFFAIDLPQDTRSAAGTVIQSLKKAHKRLDIHWARPENLHITLQFIKTLHVTDIEPLIAQVRIHLGEITPFFLQLTHLELFPTPFHSRIISIHVIPQENLSVLAQSIGQGIETCGYPIEHRPFKGHLTLGKIRSPHIPAKLEGIPPPEIPGFFVNEIVLYRSEQGKDGSNYFPMERFTLRSSR